MFKQTGHAQTFGSNGKYPQMLRELPDVISRLLFCGVYSPKDLLVDPLCILRILKNGRKQMSLTFSRRARKSCRELQAGQSHLDSQEGEWNKLCWKLFLNTLKTNDLE